jgi:NAD(P)-dependent dehydrogenase (short-subunit alcohol dehydrogenase family)
MATLQNKIAIITGASSGIGRATAKLFAHEGCSLVLAARGRERLEALVDELRAEGCAAYAIAGDVRDERFSEQLVTEAVSRFGGLDIAFNNAGTLGPLTSTAAITLEQWNETLATNLTSAYLGAKYQAPMMMKRGAGSIIFTSTFVGYTACFAGTAAYAASKSGLIGLTQALALEFAPNNIRVNALIPGGTDTPMARAMNSTEEALAHVRSLHALDRIATPEEQARSVLYLASDASSFTTGTALLVDGGVSIKRA